jgi:steroid 5-alpha reductase family enzyme
MKLYWKGAWLGYAVLISLVWYLATANYRDPMHSAFQAVVFTVLCFLWTARGTIRAIGRAWNHSATKS